MKLWDALKAFTTTARIWPAFKQPLPFRGSDSVKLCCCLNNDSTQITFFNLLHKKCYRGLFHFLFKRRSYLQYKNKFCVFRNPKFVNVVVVLTSFIFICSKCTFFIVVVWYSLIVTIPSNCFEKCIKNNNWKLTSLYFQYSLPLVSLFCH